MACVSARLVIFSNNRNIMYPCSHETTSSGRDTGNTSLKKKKVDNSRKWDMKHGIENKYFRRIKDTENLHIVSCAEKIQFLFLALV